MKETILTVYKKPVILVDVVLPARDSRFLNAPKSLQDAGNDSMEELAQLAYTAGAIVIDEMTQVRKTPDTAFFIGQGKAQELAELIRYHKAQGVIVNADLSPAQIRNLESVLNTSVIDRTELILAIFSTHARTKQSKLQVELAQLEYTLPRLKHLWGHLSKLGGAGGVKIGMRGPGEKQLEVDRRLAFNKITSLKRELQDIQNRRRSEVASRSDNFNVALVGYTNAGKSTLMNALTSLSQLTEDKLFSTLETKTHTWELKSGQKVLLSDTVGFIRNLPHHLVSSFHATLEEVIQADMLLHIVDASSHEAESQIEAVNTVLKKIDCSNKETILVFNKVDQADSIELGILKKKFPGVHLLSALKKIGLDELEKTLDLAISARQVEISVRVPVENGRLLAYLHARGIIMKKTITNTHYQIRIKMGRRDLAKAKEFGLLYRQPVPNIRKV